MSSIERASYLAGIALLLAAVFALHRGNTVRQAELARQPAAQTTSSNTLGKGDTP